ncbi:MAG: hypothetical protein KDC88_08305 [Ignavibacteriae bacterium]|nr:hypothetical protein [Ignavibacteriota bacterium]MCB9258240.1 hypothetical protein [Ignavibacteriales bacterium]
MKYKILILSLVLVINVYPQKSTLSKYGISFKYELKNSPFPHYQRDSGHSYKNEFFDSENHYSDSTVFVFIPNYFTLKDSVDFIFYFHGWNNNIDSSLNGFNLIEQFYESKVNAIFVFPEGPKNSSDSFGGKLEDKNVFSELTLEIKNNLVKYFNSDFNIGKISLSGHSGAYRVISYIILHGGMTDNISAVYLFDALYADIEKYSYWIDHYNGKFINIFTENGGTKSESENLMVCLNAWEIPFSFIDNDDFSVDDLKTNRIIFISSKLTHNQVISTKNQFQKFIESNL